MILVTGGTGTNGREIVKALAACGQPVRVMTRSGSYAGGLPSGMESVAGDFDDASSLGRALAGIERAFLLTPSTDRAEAQQLRFVEEARKAGVRHVVKLSQFAASSDSPVRFLRYHARVEAAIEASGLEWTFLRPNLFMQGLLQFADMVRYKGVIAAPIASAPVSVVDVRDNASVATVALTQDGHSGKTYTLTGPEALTHAAMAAKLSAATGRRISFVDASDDDMRRAMVAAKMPEWQIDGLIEDYAHYRRGEASEISTGVRDATGADPRAFDAFAGENAGAFLPNR